MSVFGECPSTLQCMRCLPGTADCLLIANNKSLECKATTGCQPRTCASPYYLCFAGWSRSSEGSPWLWISDCISAGTVDPCDGDESCKHQFTLSSPLPDSVAVGSFFCQCYGNFCNHNVSVDVNPPIIEPTETIGPGHNNLSIIHSSPSTVELDSSITTTITPTPMVNGLDCILCNSVAVNCTLSENNKTLQCFIVNECVNNVIRCIPGQSCAASWSRQTSSEQWLATTSCLSGFASDQPTCQVTESYFTQLVRHPIPDSVGTGSFGCSCLGSLCNRMFGINLNNFLNSNSTTTSISPTLSIPPASTVPNLSNTTTSIVIPTSTSSVEDHTDGKFCTL